MLSQVLANIFLNIKKKVLAFLLVIPNLYCLSPQHTHASNPDNALIVFDENRTIFIRYDDCWYFLDEKDIYHLWNCPCGRQDMID